MGEPLELMQARKRHALTLEHRVRAAVKSLVDEGSVISFYRVAKRAEVARSTLYRNEALRACVEEARDRYAGGASVVGGVSGADEMLHQNAELRFELERLRHALSAAEGERDDLRRRCAALRESSRRVSIVYEICSLRDAA